MPTGFGEFLKLAKIAGLAKWAKDSSGNYTGLRSASGGVIPFQPSNSVCFVGDSRVMKMGGLYSPTVGSVTAGILTIQLAGHVRIPGERINLALISTIGGVSHPEVNKDHTVLDLVDASNFMVDLGDATLSGTVVGSGAGSAFQYISLRETGASGWPAWMMAFAGDRLYFVDNFAIGGASFCGGTTSDIINQVTKAIATGTRNIIMDAGINDINSRVAEATIWTAMKAVYALCLANNVKLYDCSTAHLGTAHSSYAGADTGYTNFGHKTNVLCTAINDRRKRFSRQNPGIVYVPLAEAVVDNSSTTGATLTANFEDGIHFNATGARLGGLTVSNAISADFPNYSRAPYCILQGNSRQGALDRFISSNPLFNDGAESSGLAASMAKTIVGSIVSTDSTIARTVALDGDTLGRNQQCVITASGAGSFTLRTAGSTAYSVADLIRAVMTFRVTGMAAVTYILAYINVPMKNSLGTDTTYTAQLFTVGQSFDNTDLPNITVSPQLPAFPSGFLDPASKNCGCGITIGFSGVGTATLVAGRMGAQKLPTL